jgi:hypothetical protein
MTKQRVTWIVLTILIGAALGGAYLIVEKNEAAMKTSGEQVPAGFLH